jgi:hypothetical protein
MIQLVHEEESSDNNVVNAGLAASSNSSDAGRQ